MVPDRNFSFPAWTEEEEVAEEEEVKEVGGEQNICLLGFSFLLTLFWNLQCSFFADCFLPDKNAFRRRPVFSGGLGFASIFGSVR